MNTELIDHYSSYLTEEITHEELMNWVTRQVLLVWRNDGPIVSLAREFDDQNFPNPKTELFYRLINLEVARHLNSNIAIGRNALAAARVAMEKLNDYGTGLALTLESIKAYQNLSPELPLIMTCFENVLKIYRRTIINENSAYLRKEYDLLLELTCTMPKNISHRHKTMECTMITLDCLDCLLAFKNDRALSENTYFGITERIVPYLAEPDWKNLLPRLNKLI